MKRYKWFPVLTFLCASSAYAGQTGLYYKVQPDDPTRSVKEAFYTGVQRKFSAPAILNPDQPWPSVVTMQMTMPPDFSSFSISFRTEMSFAAPNGAQLELGGYPNAIDSFSTTQPMLAIGGDEFGYCPGATGSFEVKEIGYDLTEHVVARFAADFVQRCASTASTTYGYVRYNSDVPLPQGQELPLAIGSDIPTLNSAGCFEATSMAGRTIELHAVNGASSFSYRWSGQVEARPTNGGCTDPRLCLGLSLDVGTTTILRYLTGTGDTLTFDLARVISEQAKVVLTATDANTGKVQSVNLTTCVSDTTKPTITIRSPREGDRIVGRNFIVDVSVEDSVDPSPYYYAQLGTDVIEFEANKPTRVAIPEPLLGNGEPLPLQFKVKAKDASFNWAESSVNVTLQHDMRK